MFKLTRRQIRAALRRGPHRNRGSFYGKAQQFIKLPNGKIKVINHRPAPVNPQPKHQES